MKFDVTQRIVIEAECYEDVGIVLDQIAKSTEKALGTIGKCDFVSFNTRPCKAMVMDDQAIGMPQPEMRGF